MTISVNQVLWGSYMNYEGPVYYGKLRYTNEGEDLLDKAFLVTSVTEGALNSVNMYDTCIMTVGAIQWCDRGSFAVCDMVGKVAEECGLDYVLSILEPALMVSNATFQRNASGRWRFFLDAGRTEVNTVALQQKLYLGCSGLKGSFTADARLRSRTWCAAMASLWDDPRAQKAQIDFTKPKLMSFVFGGTTALFNDRTVPETGWEGMLKAAVISYCINSPANVSKAVTKGIAESRAQKWSPAWCLDILHAITFIGVNTFAHRYNAIRPVLEKLFPGVMLPKNVNELASRSWHSSPPAPIEVIPPFVPEPEPMPEPTPIYVEPDPPPPLPPEPVVPYEPEPPPAPIVPSADKFAWVVLVFGFLGKIFISLLTALRKKK